MKIGIGYDVHKLVKGRKLFIGGIEIPHSHGLLGWSDGDVLLHAIIDALLGALGAGDIGKHFPPGDPKCKNIESSKMAIYCRDLLGKASCVINNIDATVVTEEPKLAPYIDLIRRKIGEIFDIGEELVNIKGKTEEGLGFTGEKKGIKAYAVCLIHKEL
jgi:2-C-methyl-D-erythritol 2,4-cyclodiphosphate synthase